MKTCAYHENVWADWSTCIESPAVSKIRSPSMMQFDATERPRSGSALAKKNSILDTNELILQNHELHTNYDI